MNIDIGYTFDTNGLSDDSQEGDFERQERYLTQIKTLDEFAAITFGKFLWSTGQMAGREYSFEGFSSSNGPDGRSGVLQ